MERRGWGGFVAPFAQMLRDPYFCDETCFCRWPEWMMPHPIGVRLLEWILKDTPGTIESRDLESVAALEDLELVFDLRFTPRRAKPVRQDQRPDKPVVWR